MGDIGKLQPPLTDRMRSNSKKQHDKSDRLVNLKLALVLTSPKLYGEAISLFAPVYSCLEGIFCISPNNPSENLNNIKDKRLIEIFKKLEPVMPYLRRTPGFESDMSYYLGVQEQSEVKMRLMTKGHPSHEYIEHLHALEKNDPIRLLAYLYHMYMAIFAGGYIIQKMVRKTMGIPKDSKKGVCAFALLEVPPSTQTSPNSKSIRTHLKKIINEEIAPLLTDAEIESILDESNKVFERNNVLVSSVKDTDAFQKASDSCVKTFLYPVVCGISGILLYLWTRRK